MPLHAKPAVMLAVVCLLTGCGFVPKKPPLPDLGRRIPINHAAPRLNHVASSPPLVASTPARPTLVSETTHVARNPQDELMVPTPAPEQPHVEVVPGTGDADGLPATHSAGFLREPTQEPKGAGLPAVAAAPTSQSAIHADPQPLILSEVTFSWSPPQESQTSANMTAATSGAVESTKVTASTDPVAAVHAEPVEDAKAATPQPERQWAAKSGTTLAELITEWASADAWTVQWSSEVDFAIEAPFAIDAPDFLTAADRIFTAYAEAGCPFGIAAYSNNVLVISTPRNCKS